MPEKFDQQSEGRWEVQIKVSDLEKGQSLVLEGSIAARKPDRLRLDLMTTMGTHIISLLVDGNEVRMALPREKRFIIAPLNDHVFVNSLNLAMDPMIFMTVLFDQAPAEKIWSCRRDERGFLLQCKHLRDKTAIRWQLRDGQRRTVEIFTGKRNLLIALNDFQAQIENAGKVFRLVPPNRYRVERHGAEASTKMKHDLSWARFKANLERSKRDRINNKQVLEPVVLETELTE